MMLKKTRYRLTSQEQKKLARPALIISLILAGFYILRIFLRLLISPEANSIELVPGFVTVVYLLVLYFLAVPYLDRFPSLHWVLSISNAGFLGILYAIQPDTLDHFPALMSAFFICFSAGISGRWPAYLFLSTSTLLHLFFNRPVLFEAGFDPILPASIGLAGVAITETVTYLHQIIQRHLKRIDILNNVARNLGSSLETHQVVSLLSAVVQKSFQADTYYVGLLKDNMIRLELFYDDGEFFPVVDVPTEGNLASWVIRNKKSLILYDLQKDTRKYDIHFVTIGKPKTSQSWMGAPIDLGGQTLGLVAVASYQKNAFDKADLELLESVAQQAALAIDNSYHHAEVEHQSHLDSLTGVYNHGYFLKSLSHEAESALQGNYSISLIMLDIDHFKQYNDNYGHLVGDQVLSMLVRNIRAHIKSTDVVGRWGGEEFAILLLRTTGAQAALVAERIRQSMNVFIMTERDNKRIPSPTVSQGIALYPAETTDIFKLVDLADQRLYRAKDRGRDQIEPQLGYWKDPESLAEEGEANPIPPDPLPLGKGECP